MENPEEFYERFKGELVKTHQFPSSYNFKFIIPNDSHKLAQIQQIFDKANPQYAYRESKNGKYTSVTVETFVLDVEAVIDYYKQVGAIEGVMML